jgi:hypothetical protein
LDWELFLFHILLLIKLHMFKDATCDVLVYILMWRLQSSQITYLPPHIVQVRESEFLANFQYAMQYKLLYLMPYIEFFHLFCRPTPLIPLNNRFLFLQLTVSGNYHPSLCFVFKLLRSHIKWIHKHAFLKDVSGHMYKLVHNCQNLL